MVLILHCPKTILMQHGPHLELVLVVRDLLDLGPREGDLGGELVALVVDVDAERIDTEQHLRAALIHNREVGDAEHFLHRINEKF